MSAKDFHVNAVQVDSLLRQHELSCDQDFEALSDTYGCLAVEHWADTRVDLLTYDLAFKISLTHTDSPRQIMADLEPHTRHFPTRSITFWENVGSKED